MVFYVEQTKKYCQSLIRFKDNIENELFEFLVLEKLKPLSDRHYDDTKKWRRLPFQDDAASELRQLGTYHLLIVFDPSTHTMMLRQ